MLNLLKRLFKKAPTGHFQLIWAFPEGVEVLGMKTCDDYLYVCTSTGVFKYIPASMEEVKDPNCESAYSSCAAEAAQ